MGYFIGVCIICYIFLSNNEWNIIINIIFLKDGSLFIVVVKCFVLEDLNVCC